MDKPPRKPPTCSTCGATGHTSASQKFHPTPKEDVYTPDALRYFYQLHKQYVLSVDEGEKLYKTKIRRPNMPEHISENIIKFIIQNKIGDKTATWNCKGDLFSEREGKQECKCFTSDGPPSFTPTSNWDVIYFLDARKWVDDSFVLYRVGLKQASPEWRAIKVNKETTFGEHADGTRRPRITWEALYPQIASHCTKVFEGSFEDIFKMPEEEPVSVQSDARPEQTPRSPQACTDVNQPS